LQDGSAVLRSKGSSGRGFKGSRGKTTQLHCGSGFPAAIAKD
jgi:hypothetical protein